MEDSIKKLIKEYEEKVKYEGIIIRSLSEDIKILKGTGSDTEGLRNARRVAQARQQAYVQAVADFDSLLDNL